MTKLFEGNATMPRKGLSFPSVTFSNENQLANIRMIRVRNILDGLNEKEVHIVRLEVDVVSAGEHSVVSHHARGSPDVSLLMLLPHSVPMHVDILIVIGPVVVGARAPVLIRLLLLVLLVVQMGILVVRVVVVQGIIVRMISAAQVAAADGGISGAGSIMTGKRTRAVAYERMF